MTLHEAIEQLIALGENDPHEITAKIRSRYDEKWLGLELLRMADDLLPDVARHVIGARRRSAQSLARVATLDRRDVMLQSAWLPGLGWIEFGKFTVEHWELLASRYRKGASALNRYADWCQSNAALMVEQRVDEFRKVKGALPALPPAEAVA